MTPEPGCPLRRLTVMQRSRFGLWLVAGFLLSSCGDAERGRQGEPSAVCAAAVEYDGRTYVGYGDLKRFPATTGRIVTGTIPGCDDGHGVGRAESVDVHELRAIGIERAVLVNDALYVREDTPLPGPARSWFRSPRCVGEAPFELTGRWLGVTGGPEPRFDGDIRPPYYLQVEVKAGARPYVGTKLSIHATTQTEPLLTTDDVKTSLWKRGLLSASVHCEGDDFVADELRTTPSNAAD